MIPSGSYIVIGTRRNQVNLGIAQGATEGGQWVFWHWTCTASVFVPTEDMTVHATYDEADAEAGRRLG